MLEVYKAILVALEKGQSIVRVAVIESAGSTPRAAGAGMAVYEDGSLTGTIGGGSVENESHIIAKAMSPGSAKVCNFDLTANDAANLGMVCGGAMSVLIDSLLPTDENIAFIREVLAQPSTNEQRFLRTVLNPQGEISHRELVVGLNIPKASVAHANQKDPKDTVLIEPFNSPTTIHFIGAGHVAQATAKIAAFTGFRIVVVDDREDFANTERFPDADEIRVADTLTDCLPSRLHAKDYVVIMTRGHIHDRDVLAQALKTEAGYIGMIGSKKKKTAVYDSLLKDGFDQVALDAVHCPIGLSIGADTPEEIAVSIMAELISMRAKSTE